MPWVWVGVGLVVWTVASFVVITLCMSVRQIDARLGRDCRGPGVTPEPEPRAGADIEVE